MLSVYKHAVNKYQRNHLNEENFLALCNMFLDLESQQITKVYRDSCALFESHNHLVEFRTRFLQVLGDVAGFE